jgi:antirestriction protein ArdC
MINDKVAEIITNKIIEKLKQGIVAWHKTWKIARPQNFVTKKVYRGINILLLNMTDFSCPFWASFKQIQELGGKVKKGEKSTMVVYWKILEKQETVKRENGKKENVIHKIPLMRYYNIFNLEQTTGIKYKVEKQEFNKIEKCEEVIAGYKDKPEVKHNLEKAYYAIILDYISIPNKKQFETEEGYYATLFHEYIHSTGAEHRLNRKTVAQAGVFGSENYSKEELVAELGASFLSAITGIEQKTIDNSASYIQNWLEQLQNDTSLIIYASAQANKAIDYILNGKKEEVKTQVTAEIKA